MSASFEKIDYSLRPAKHTERRMLSEILRRLSPFQALTEYTYVGFGAIAFSDFILFQRMLGFQEMISIERSEAGIGRVRANIPFRIRVQNKHSNAALPLLKWKRPHVLWLDYDDPLTPDMLLDARIVTSRACSGTALAISFQCQKAREVDEVADANAASPIELFRDRFGRGKVPENTQEEQLYGWLFAALGRHMLASEIDAALAERNATLADDRWMHVKYVCNIEYQDGAKMTTLVCVFYSVSDTEKLKMCGFDGIDFIPFESQAIRIVVPKLTLREIRDLERQLPLTGRLLKHKKVPKSEAAQFARLYRYLPNFAVLEG